MSYLRLRSLFIVLFVNSVLSTLALAQGKMRIVVSVDWEGSDLLKENLDAMQAFREDYPEIPLQHFLNAAYYTKAKANAAAINRAVRSVLRPGDEHGLHIHAWRSLVQASGVSFRTQPSFVAGAVNLATCGLDCGEDVPLTAYSESELRKVIGTSIRILESQGFNRARSFRAGGWQANDKVLHALAAEGITLDSSATDAAFLREAWGDYNLYSFVGRLWPNSVSTSQPYRYTTRKGLQILELPNNGCLADYMSGEDMLKVFESNALLFQRNRAQDIYLSIGFHQETAAEYLPNLRDALERIRSLARAQNIPIEFVVAPL